MTSERFLYPVSPANRPGEAGLRATVERLAGIERPPCSPGEREAAHLIADRLRGLGAAARVEEVPAYGTYARPVGALTGLAALAALAGSRSRRLGALGAAVAVAGLADEAGPGRRLARALLSRRRTACNVVGGVGDGSARRTLVVMAHHDAAPSGRVYDQRPVRWAARHVPLPRLAGRAAPGPPVWWPVLAGPVLVGLGAATGHAWPRRLGGLLSALATAAMADLGGHRAVPGANDGLSGVSVLVALAEAVRLRPLGGLRVVLLSAGAEEALQEGVQGFARLHFPDLPLDSTWFLDLRALGSGELVLPRARGPLGAFDPALGDLIAGCAAEQRIGLHRGTRSRADGGAAVPARHGYPAACLLSVDEQGLIPHYRLPTDVPEHVDYRCVADAAQLVEAVARALATR